MSFKDSTTNEYHEIGADEATRLYFETFRKYLINHVSTTTHTVIGDARPFYYNLYGYLIYKKYSAKLHWLILMLSDIDSPEDFNEDTTTLVIPDLSLVEEIYAMSDL